MATPNIVPRADKEGSLGTSSKAWGGLNVESSSTKGSSAAKIENNDADQTALEIAATANTTAPVLAITAPALTTGNAAFFDINDALTTSHDNKLLFLDYDKSGVTASGQTASVTGFTVNMADAATNHANSQVEMYGAQIDVDSANAQGTITQKGLVLNVAADGVGDAATTSGIETTVMDGGTDIKMMSHADTADYCTIATTTNGATTITTVDGGATAAHFEVAADGKITLDAATDIVLETGTTSTNSTSIPLRKFAPTGDNTAGNYNGGDVVYFGGTTSMTTGAIYHYKSDGTWELADADAVATSDGLLGVALGAATDTNGVLLRGMVTIDHDPGAIGDVLFLSTTAGDCSATAPSGSGDIVRVIGYQVNHASNGEIWFCPDGTYVELA